MTFGIAGLGLIGGSFAKAIKKNLNDKILGYDINNQVVESALNDKVIDDTLTDNNIKECDIIFVALYPEDVVDFVKKHRKNVKKGAIIIDLCGIKTAIVEPLKECVKDSHFTFIGGHPMAGTEHSGYENSTASMFQGASMIFTTDEFKNCDIIEQIKPIFKSIGFKKVVITDCYTHDKIIAFTSQLAHIVSNAYMKSETALIHHGFSAGSYKDLTRVAKLNENMWTQLFLDNKEPLISEIDNLIEQLSLYSTALKENNADKLKALLKDGSDRKEKVDNA